MQVLSQLSYNPTLGPSVHSSALVSGAIPTAFVAAARRASSALLVAGLHPPGSLQIEGSAYCSRVIAFAGV